MKSMSNVSVHNVVNVTTRLRDLGDNLKVIRYEITDSVGGTFEVSCFLDDDISFTEATKDA